MEEGGARAVRALEHKRVPFFGPDAWAPMAQALVAYMEGDKGAELTVHADEGEPDPIPISLFFRSLRELREVDREALSLVRGRVLDAGAGVGPLSLILQEGGVDVAAVEVIPEAVEIMAKLGVRDAREGRVQELPPSRDFDTVLALMNGAGLAETLHGLPSLLQALDGLLVPGGRILLDSTDILEGKGGFLLDPALDEQDYPGELQYQMEFRGERGAPFPYLFVDPVTLGRVAEGVGWRTELAWRGRAGDYLARLTRGGD